MPKYTTNIDKTKRHSENGLIQSTVALRNGFDVTVSIATGIAGESSCLIINNKNLSNDIEANKELVMSFSSVEELKKLGRIIDGAIKNRNQTLVKESKK